MRLDAKTKVLSLSQKLLEETISSEHLGHSRLHLTGDQDQKLQRILPPKHVPPSPNLALRLA